MPNVPGSTLTADAFMRPDEAVGFRIVHQPLSVAEHFHDFYELAFVLEGAGIHVGPDGSRCHGERRSS